MEKVFIISHPEVVVDPGVEVPRWHLSDNGIRRMRAFAAECDGQHIAAVWSSDETKAIEAAGLLAARFGLPVHVSAMLRENDRSATGFLPPAEFEHVADAFFARPGESVRGWERAGDAQARIASAVDTIIAKSPHGTLAVVAHGGVGTLLLCLYAGVPISRKADQPFQGHYWSFERQTRRVLHPWLPLPAAPH